MQPDGGLAGACVKTEPGTGPGFRAARPPHPPLPPRQRGPSVSGSVKVQHAGPRNLLVLECCVYILFSDDSSNCRTLSWGVLLTHVQISLNLVDISWNRFFRCCCSATKQLLLLSVVSDSLRPHGLRPTGLLCPWNFPGKNTGVGCHVLLQGIFLTRDRTHVSCIGRLIPCR